MALYHSEIKNEVKVKLEKVPKIYLTNTNKTQKPNNGSI